MIIPIVTPLYRAKLVEAVSQLEVVYGLEYSSAFERYTPAGLLNATSSLAPLT